jgi:hypothetical protein
VCHIKNIKKTYDFKHKFSCPYCGKKYVKETFAVKHVRICVRKKIESETLKPKKESLEDILNYFKSQDARVIKNKKIGNRQSYSISGSGFTVLIVENKRKNGTVYEWIIRETENQHILAKGTSLKKFKNLTKSVFY